MLTKESVGVLGLREGSMATPSMVHNGGWYSSTGEKIGWGDLGPSHFRRIQAGLKPGELFIVLGERDSFWNFVTHNPGLTGDFCKTDAKEKNPGINYLIEKARWCITNEVFYWIEPYRGVDGEFEGIAYKALDRKTFGNMIAKAV